MARVFGNAIGKQGQRSYTRLRLGIPAVLVLPHGQLNCLLDDVSISGARLRCDTPVRAGIAAELRFDRYRVFCKVAWTRGIQAGLAFADYLETSDMQRLRWIVENRDQYQIQRETVGARSWVGGGRSC